jgi:hypothetical protein
MIPEAGRAERTMNIERAGKTERTTLDERTMPFESSIHGE